MSSESKDTVWTALSVCSVCGKPLDTSICPQLLPCCHSSCKDCIEDNKNQFNDFVNTDNNERPQFRCKVCFQEYNPNECIENSFQWLYWSKSQNCGSNESPMCEACDAQNKSVIKCQTCGWICEECQTLHKTLKVFKEHDLDERSKTNQLVPKNVCQTHNEEITVYCKTCRTAYCARCILKDHNLHVYEDSRDNAQIEQYYQNLTQKVEQIQEKRSFSENTLKKFETIDSDLSGQKKVCVNKIKYIVERLEEKVKELGTALYDKVDEICKRKEKEFNDKKQELTEMNASFKFIEDFISAVTALKDSMGVMKAQDLLNSQLEKLLNRPCSHPDFIQPFTIEVIDKLEGGPGEGQNFNVGKMIDGVFNMCFDIVSSDDPKEPTVNQNNGNSDSSNNDRTNQPDDEVVVLPNPNENRVPNPSVRVGNVRVIKGNSSNQMLANMLNTNTHNSYDYTGSYNVNNTNANQMLKRTLALPAANATQVPTQRLQHNSSLPLHNLNAMTNSVTQSMPQMPNNFVSQTGIGIAVNTPVVCNVSQAYGSPQVYRPITNQMIQSGVLIPTANISTVPITNISNNNYYNNLATTVCPNVSLQSNQMAYVSAQGFHQQQQQQQQQTTYKHNLQTYAGGHITASTIAPLNSNPPAYRPQNIRQMAQPIASFQMLSQLRHRLSPNNPNVQTIQSQQQLQQIQRQQEMLKRREIDKIAANLQTSEPLPNNSMTQRVMEIINRESRHQSGADSILQPQTTISNSNPNTSSQSVVSRVNRVYQLHIPEDTTITSVPNTSEPERTQSNGSVAQRRDSIQSSASTPGRIETCDQTTNCVNSTELILPDIEPRETRSDSTDSNIQTPLSVPIMPDVIEDIDGLSNDLEVSPEEHENPIPMELDERLETIEPSPTSNLPSVESVLSPTDSTTEATNSSANEDLNTNNNNKEDNREVNASASRSAAPVARIAPITNECEAPDPRAEDLLDDNESIDEDADCVVCNEEYGEFICCALCPRAFHKHCHIPELKEMPTSTFNCTFCRVIPQTQTGRSRRSGLNDRQQMICERILIGLLCHKKSEHFKPPFSDKIAPNFTLIAIKKNLENKKYENEIEFIDHIKRVFSHYKNRDITPEDMADYNTIEKYFKTLVQKLLPSFMEALQNSSSANNIDSNSSNELNKRSKTSCISI